MSNLEKRFFGLHFDFHASKDDKEIGKGLTVEHLVEQIKKVNPDYLQCDCKGHNGYTSWPTTVGSTSPGVVADALMMWTRAAKEVGIPIIMHYSGVWDDAALEKHPEYGAIVRSEDDTSKLEPSPRICVLSRYVDDLVIPQFNEILEKYDVDGFWIDGDCWALKICYCERCKEKYTKDTGKTEIPMDDKHPDWPGWLEFHRTNYFNYVKKYTDAVHKAKKDCTVCSNWMFTVRAAGDPNTVPVDYISGDFAYKWSLYCGEKEARYVTTLGKPWELMAWAFTSYGRMGDWMMKPVPALCQELSAVMSVGGSVVIYDQPDRTGHIVPWRMDELAKINRFCQERRDYCSHMDSVPQIGILFSIDGYYKNNVPLFDKGDSTNDIEGALIACLHSGYDAEILNEYTMKDTMFDYPVCIVPNAAVVTKEISDKFEDYVKKGGKLILAGLEKTTAFDALLGVKDTGKIIGDGRFYYPNLAAFGQSVPLMGDWRVVEPKKAEVLESMFYGRNLDSKDNVYQPAVTQRAIGKGSVTGFYGSFFDNYTGSRYPMHRRMVKNVLSKIDGGQLVRLYGPSYVHTSVNTKGNKTMVHLLNSASGTPNTDENPIIETVPDVHNLVVQLPRDKEPKRVCLAPENVSLEYSFDGSRLTIEVPKVGIYDIVVIED